MRGCRLMHIGLLWGDAVLPGPRASCGPAAAWGCPEAFFDDAFFGLTALVFFLVKLEVVASFGGEVSWCSWASRSSSSEAFAK